MPTSTQSRPVQNLSAIWAKRCVMSPHRSRTRPHLRSRVLWVTASTRSTCSPLLLGLQRQPPEVDLEVGEVIGRCPDHGFESSWPACPVTVGTGFGSEHGPDLLHVKAGPCPVHDRVEDALHASTVVEQQGRPTSSR